MFLGGKPAITHGPLNVFCIHMDGRRFVINPRFTTIDFKVHFNRASGGARFPGQHRNRRNEIAHLETNHFNLDFA
jgi:hypothetical protein